MILILSKHQICAMLVARDFMNIEKYPKLIQVYKYLYNKEFDQHRALSDSKATARCFFNILQRKDFKIAIHN